MTRATIRPKVRRLMRFMASMLAAARDFVNGQEMADERQPGYTSSRGVRPRSAAELPMKPDLTTLTRTIEAARRRLDPLYAQVGRVLVGQRLLMDRLLIGLLTRGHLLLEGVPGLAKTLAVRTLAQALD